MVKRIVIMSGGTGGHVFPALAVAQLLAAQGWQVSWLGTQKGLESRVVPEHGIAIDWLPVAGIRGKGGLEKILALGLLLKAFWQAGAVLRKRKPDVVLGMGGFVAGPGGVMAKLLRIPLVIHEQNRVPGTTNRLLARMANRVLEAFPGSFKAEVKAQCTGNPLRQQFLGKLDTKPDKTGGEVHILVVGGSQGAQVLNERVPEALAALAEVKIRHQTGTAMQAQVQEHYESLGVTAKVTAFIEDMAEAYQWADLVVCRAGAMTVSEVAAAGVPAILVPLPNAIDDHQTANARFLSEAGAGMVIIQQDLTPQVLQDRINQLMTRLDAMAKAARACARLDATDLVAAVCAQEAKP